MSYLPAGRARLFTNKAERTLAPNLRNLPEAVAFAKNGKDWSAVDAVPVYRELEPIGVDAV
jgi:hypothetical protein